MRLLLAIALLTASLCQAQSAPLVDLQQRLAGIESLSGTFRQTLVSMEGEPLEHSSGHFRLLQPAYFSWQIELPDQQLLLAAQGVLWHYDVELETVTRRNIPPDNPYSPLEILAGDSQTLGEYYQVESLGPDSWRLLPNFESGDFLAITLKFNGQLPLSMDVLDPLQRVTQIVFGQLEHNPGLSAADFVFVPPDGVDVYSHER
jgi:outer membrane lipoprotein carrier protein